MNNSKYFVPKLSDLFVGYECELYTVGEYDAYVSYPNNEEREKDFLNEDNFSSFHKTTLTSKDFRIYDNFGLVKEGGKYNPTEIRTPYLTPHQIEDEGWVKEPNIPWTFGYTKDYHFNTYYLAFTPKTEQSKEFLMISHFVEGDHEFMYKGTCPSINEFRKIMSLLEFE